MPSYRLYSFILTVGLLYLAVVSLVSAAQLNHEVEGPLLAAAFVEAAQLSVAESGSDPTRYLNVNSTAELRWSEADGDDYLAEIQTLYQTSDPSQALVRHINSLLTFYAYGDQRIIAASRLGAPSRHRIHVSDEGEIIALSTFGEATEHSRFRVFGINPYLRYDCSDIDASCWLIHPVTGEPWLQFTESDEAGRELTRALSELIKHLQAS